VKKQIPSIIARAKRQHEASALKADLREGGFIAPKNLDSQRVTCAERAAVANFLAAKQPRRYADHDSGDDFNLCVFLKGTGHTVQRNCSVGSRRAPFFIDEKPYSRAGFIAFVNGLRATLGMQPLGIPA